MLIQRFNQEVIYHSFQKPFITAVLGPRRVGKSTLVKQFIEQLNQAAWALLNMDHWEERRRIENGELKKIIQEKTKLRIGDTTKIWVAIDEAQKCPALFEQIKLIYDEFKDKNAIKFILTGSGFLSLHQLSAESLAGRIELHHLREFGLQEAVALKEQSILPKQHLLDLICHHASIADISAFIDTRSPFKPLIEEILIEQLIWGGFPEIITMTNSLEKRDYLANYLQTYFEKDIRAISTINDLHLYHKLMEIIAEQTGSICQDARLVETLGCSRDTLKKYRGFLSATLLYQEIYPFIGSSLKRLVKTPKVYLQNNGLISYLTGIEQLDVLEKTGLIGHRFENWFLNEAEIWLDQESKRHHIYYWRTSAGVEVDFVIEKNPEIFPFEITYSKRIQDKKIKNLINFLRDEPKAKYGIYIYMGDFHYDATSRIYFIPAWGLG